MILQFVIFKLNFLPSLLCSFLPSFLPYFLPYFVRSFLTSFLFLSCLVAWLLASFLNLYVHPFINLGLHPSKAGLFSPSLRPPVSSYPPCLAVHLVSPLAFQFPLIRLN